jgi:hypothetical protein
MCRVQHENTLFYHITCIYMLIALAINNQYRPVNPEKVNGIA